MVADQNPLQKVHAMNDSGRAWIPIDEPRKRAQRNLLWKGAEQQQNQDLE
jgi:hypothetical protein